MGGLPFLLTRLRGGLPVDSAVVRTALASLSAGTVRDYCAAWQRFARFARERGVQPWPVVPSFAGEFLLVRVQGVTRAAHPVSEFCSAVAWLCRLAGAPNPLESDGLFGALRQGLAVSRTTEPVRHAPVVDVSPVLQAALEGDPHQLPLSELRTRVVVLLFVLALARPSDVAQTRRDQVQFRDDGSVALLLPRSKTDKARDGQVLRVGAPEDEGLANPVEFVRAWLVRTEDASLPHSRPLFPGPTQGLPFSSDWFANTGKNFARAHGAPDSFTSRSFRASSATALLAAGVPTWQVQLLGRWTSEGSMHKSYNAAAPRRVQETLTRPGPRNLSR